MKKMIVYLLTVFFIVVIGAVCIIFCESPQDGAAEFLKSYGWETGEIIEEEKIKIPLEFDTIYSDYNELQKQAGLDLLEYRGKDAVRYTYEIKNFPYDTSSKVRANVIVVGERIVAGDIMTVELGGFMYSLNYLKSGK